MTLHNEPEGIGGNKVFNRGATSGRGRPREKIFLHQIF